MDAVSFLQGLFSSGRAVDIALAVIGLEFAYLIWRSPQADRLSAGVTWFLALGPGVCLMLALRCALTGASILWIAFWLALSLPLHVVDIVKRRS